MSMALGSGSTTAALGGANSGNSIRRGRAGAVQKIGSSPTHVQTAGSVFSRGFGALTHKSPNKNIGQLLNNSLKESKVEKKINNVATGQFGNLTAKKAGGLEDKIGANLNQANLMAQRNMDQDSEKTDDQKLTESLGMGTKDILWAAA